MKLGSVSFALFVVVALIVILALCANPFTRSDVPTNANATQNGGERTTGGASPVVLGHGVGRFKVGPLLARDDFENLDSWVIQVDRRPGFSPARIRARDRSLDCLVPGRGCTVWFSRKLRTRVTITYDVLCPTPTPAINGVQPRDVNNFWMATDPADPDRGLFDPNRFTGSFGSYDKMHGYYASTGGGGAVANLTTRMRRYPRKVDGTPVEHVALTDKDERPGYLITPDRVMSVQLVAYDDVVQYIVNGRLNYEIARGDRIQIEGRSSDGKREMREATYEFDRFPVYREGYFGFRMVGTHHIYSNFRVYSLTPDDDETTPAAGLEVKVAAGGDIQKAIDEVSSAGGGTVWLAAGVHEIRAAIKMRSNVTLRGEGSSTTTIKTSKVIKSIEQASEGLENVTIRDLKITGVAVDGSHAIHLVSYERDHTNIAIVGVHASETGWGVHIKGAEGVTIENCEFTGNGARGKEGYAHNLYLRRCKYALVKDSTLSGSTTGNGCNISYSENITIDHCEISNNYFRGVRAADTVGYTVKNSRIGGNGKVGLLANREKVATKNIRFVNNVVFDNGEGGIQTRNGVTGVVTGCRSFNNKKFDFDLNEGIEESGNSTEPVDESDHATTPDR